MADKLDIGAIFPDMQLNLADGGTLSLPREPAAKHRVALFYRGHW